MVLQMVQSDISSYLETTSFREESCAGQLVRRIWSGFACNNFSAGGCSSVTLVSGAHLGGGREGGYVWFNISTFRNVLRFYCEWLDWSLVVDSVGDSW